MFTALVKFVCKVFFGDAVTAAVVPVEAAAPVVSASETLAAKELELREREIALREREMQFQQQRWKAAGNQLYTKQNGH